MNTPQTKSNQSKAFAGIQRPNVQVLKPHALDLKDLLKRLDKTK
jgi:hypothetical protein